MKILKRILFLVSFVGIYFMASGFLCIIKSDHFLLTRSYEVKQTFFGVGVALTALGLLMFISLSKKHPTKLFTIKFDAKYVVALVHLCVGMTALSIVLYLIFT